VTDLERAWERQKTRFPPNIEPMMLEAIQAAFFAGAASTLIMISHRTDAGMPLAQAYREAATQVLTSETDIESPLRDMATKGSVM
jgi:hypothetical protein